MLWTFLPIAALMTITPGPGTAMVVRSALRDGWRSAVLTVAGNSVGVVAWALLSVLGISALVAASELAFLALKVIGAAVLVWLGVQSLRRAGAEPAQAPPRAAKGRAFRDGLVTSLANPKLAVFFVALFPQFIESGAEVLSTTLLMAALIRDPGFRLVHVAGGACQPRQAQRRPQPPRSLAGAHHGGGADRPRRARGDRAALGG